MAISVDLDEQLTERVRQLAEALRSSSPRIVREAVVQYVEREERRAAFLREGVDAWEEYERTGLHLTGAEADEWLSKLEAGEDVEAPLCHR